MKLSCHCGNVQLQVAESPENLTSCNCSICNRYGAQWGYYVPGDVTVREEASALVAYRFGEENLDFMHCPTCGCLTHYVTTEKCSEQKIAVNFRMASLADVRDIPVKRFDGADTWKFLVD